MATNPTQEKRLNEHDKRLIELAGEIRFNENILLRTEAIISELVELNADCKSRNDLQDERILRILEELKHHHKDIEEIHKENTSATATIVASIKQVEDKLITQMASLDDRIRALENWKWILMGGGIVVIWMFEKFNLAQMIG